MKTASDILSGQGPVLRTERLLLRPLEMSDVEALWPHMADPEISRLMAWEAHTSISQTTAFVRNEIMREQEGRGMTWGIVHAGNLCGIISLIGLLRTHRALTYNRAELAYWVATASQGQGIMTEAGATVLQFAFEALDLHKVVVSHFDGNNASRGLILRLGFQYVGTQRAEFQKSNVWYDHVMYELLKPDDRPPLNTQLDQSDRPETK